MRRKPRSEGNVIDALSASPLAWAAARALVAFVWQGAIIGALTAIGLVLLRRSSAHLRYQLACVGLAALCAAPVATGFVLFDPNASSHSKPNITQRAALPTALDDVDNRARAIGAANIPEQSSGSSVLRRLANAAEWLNARLPALLLV